MLNEFYGEVPANCSSKHFVCTVRGLSPCNQSLRVKSSGTLRKHLMDFCSRLYKASKKIKDIIRSIQALPINAAKEPGESSSPGIARTHLRHSFIERNLRTRETLLE